MGRPQLAEGLFRGICLLLAGITFSLISLAYYGWPCMRLCGFSVGRCGLLENAGPQPGEPFGINKDSGGQYLLGAGKGDITGPVVEINMMGYADPKQLGSGLRQRLYSRAFIIGDLEIPDNRFVYIVLDTQSGDTAVRYGVLEELAKLGSEYEMYGENNIAITGTHSHSGPGAWLNYLLPQITSKGFDKQSYRAIVDGTIMSIKRAHESLAPGYLTYGAINISDTNINRSPYAYIANPEEERDQYDHDVDKELSMLRLQRATDGKSMGVLTWFPVHGTSVLANNTLISGDNKGVAAYLFENSVKGDDTTTEDFVAGFSQANVGDTSPNVLGAYCEDGSGEQCNFKDSTCSGKSKFCHGRGPFFGLNDSGTRSGFEIGRRQFQGAKSLYDSLSTHGIPIRGSQTLSLHTYRSLLNYTFPHPNGSLVSTCPPALGYAFAAGTTDWPASFDFRQTSPTANPLWAVARKFLREPSDAQKLCHHPKEILLDLGEVDNPYRWTPEIIDIQLLRVGQVLLIISPGEATTMAGRRWKSAIAKQFSELQSLSAEPTDRPIVLLGGPGNTYAHYISTEEEYSIQRFEGASTLFGPHTLNALINLTSSLLEHFFPPSADHALPHLDPGPHPPIHINNSLSFISGVIHDRAPLGKSFGEQLQPPNDTYSLDGSEVENVEVRFVGANPRNNLRLETTYAAIERRDSGGHWKIIRDDGDWSLTFHWERVSELFGTSEVKIVWEIEQELEHGGLAHQSQELRGGTYRVHYWGDAKRPVLGTIEPFEGTSAEFTIV